MKPSYSSTIRIASNYARLISTLVIGLFVVRILLRFGDDAFGLISLLGTGTGISLMLKTVVRRSTVPVLGEAFHSGKKNWFEQVYNSAMLCSFVAGVATLLIFCGFAACLPLLNFPDEFYFAALVFVAASGVQSFIDVFICPLLNFYVVSERMVAYNTVLFMERVADIAAAVLTLFVVGTASVSTAVITYGVCSAGFSVLNNVIAAILIVRAEKRLAFRPGMVNRIALSTFLKSVGWNGCVIFAMNFHARVDMVIMNLYFGLFGNMVFGLANQSVCYLRQTVFGLVAGLDAVAARVAKDGGGEAVVRLMQRSTRLQSLLVFPAMVFLIVYTEPLISLWLGGRLEDPDTTIPSICWLTRILVFGLAARCLSEGWMSILNGTGRVSSYAVSVLIGGLLNPVLACVALTLAPEEYKFFVTAIIFSVLLVTVHLIAIPWSVAREYHLRLVDVVGPLAGPAFATLLCAVGSQLLANVIDDNASGMIVFAAVFSISYIVATFAVLLTREDRLRIVRVAQKLIPGVRTA